MPRCAARSPLKAPGTPLLQALDEAPLTRRFWVLAGAVMVGAVLDLFDFFLIAFVVPILADEWDLTFGQAAAMLLSAGVGAIAGSIVWGRARRPLRPARPLIGGDRDLLARRRSAGARARRWLVVHRALPPRRGRGRRRRRGDRGADGARVHADAPAHEGDRLRHHRDGADRHRRRGRRRGADPWRPLFAIGLLPVASLVVHRSPTCPSRRAGC